MGRWISCPRRRASSTMHTVSVSSLRVSACRRRPQRQRQETERETDCKRVTPRAHGPASSSRRLTRPPLPPPPLPWREHARGSSTMGHTLFSLFRTKLFLPDPYSHPPPPPPTIEHPSQSPMATAAAISVRAPSPSLRAGSPTPSRRASATPPVHLSPRASRRLSLDKENVSLHAAMEPNGKATAENGHDAAAVAAVPVANGRPRDGSVSEDDVDNVLRRRGAVPRSPRTVPRSPPPGVHTLPTIVAHVEMDSSALSDSEAHAPPPAPSAVFGTAAPGTEVRRRRRTSSIHVKPPPGVKPTKAVDWEIPRKAFHSSIGELIASHIARSAVVDTPCGHAVWVV